MWEVFSTLVPNNVGMSFEYIVLIIVNLGLLVFYAKNFKLGLLTGFVLNGMLFMAFYQFGLNWTPPLIITFLNLIVMAMTLYSVDKVSSGSGGFV